jgi:hypothetical protein
MSLVGDLGPRLAAIQAALDPRLSPPRGLKFLREWRPLLERATRVARDPALGETAFAVGEAVPALDELAFAFRRSRDVDQGPLEAARAALAAVGTGIHWLPPLVGAPRSFALLEARAGDLGLPAALVGEPVPSSVSPGNVVAVERRGLVESGKLVTRALVHVASGEPRTPRVEVLEAALVALEAARPAREDHARLVREIDRCERDDPRANGEAALRFAVSALERAGGVPAARAAALAFLVGRGISPVTLARGERFDPEKHPASAFERRLAPGTPRGSVLATELTGFRDERGVVLTRAVVVVAE